jgi:hypothetical protein
MSWGICLPIMWCCVVCGLFHTLRENVWAPYARVKLGTRERRQLTTIQRRQTPWNDEELSDRGEILQSHIVGAVLCGRGTGYFTLRLRVPLIGYQCLCLFPTGKLQHDQEFGIKRGWKFQTEHENIRMNKYKKIKLVGTKHTWKIREMCIQFWLENLKEKEKFQGFRTDWSLSLKLMLKNSV